ncbi:MAG TPA: maleylpyruvate isomerase N-terminal domain-containing protein [Acidimicrobiales bacterium]
MDDASTTRLAFADAAAAFDDLVGSIDPPQLAAPASDEWTVRELVGHTSRALLTIETSLAAPLDDSTRRLASAADYFCAAMSVAGVHAGIVERARQAATGLGDDPRAYVRDTVARVLPLVDRTPDDVIVQHFAGRIAFIDYLQTRTVELVLHGVDLQRALGRAVAAPPRAAALTRDVLLAMADRGDPLAVACALSGRSTADGCNLLA